MDIHFMLYSIATHSIQNEKIQRKKSMSFRTVVIQNRCKLDLKMNYLVCRGEEEQKVFIPEISVLILASTAIALTSALVSALIKNNVKIIFCDEKHNPPLSTVP